MDFKKRAENFFSLTRMTRERNGVKKKGEDSHEYREQINGGKKKCEKFFIFTIMSRAKKLILKNAWKILFDSQECREQKNDIKKRAKIFLKILTNIGSKKMAR